MFQWKLYSVQLAETAPTFHACFRDQQGFIGPDEREPS